MFLKGTPEMAEQEDRVVPKSEKLLHLCWSCLDPGLTDYYCCLIAVNGKEVMRQAWNEGEQAVFCPGFCRSRNYRVA